MKEPDNSETICHILPCNVEYTGAMDRRQFQPQGICSSQTKPTDDNDNGRHDTVEAVNLRGRGLLAAVPGRALSSNVVTGRVFDVTSSSCLQEQAAQQFSFLQQWHHEHLPEAVALKPHAADRALEWCAVAQALHDPLPVLED